MQYSDVSNTFRRHWKLFLAVTLGTAILLFATFRPILSLYRAEMRFIVGTRPLDSTLLSEEEKYYNWVASEYVGASLSDYINGTDFKAIVSESLVRDGYADLDLEAVREYLSAGFARSRLVVAVTNPDEAMVEKIAFSAATALLTVSSVELSEADAALSIDVNIPQLERSPAFAYPIDNELIVTKLDTSSDLVKAIALRIVAAIVIGGLTVILVEFYDPTIRTRNSAEILTIPILAEIPCD